MKKTPARKVSLSKKSIGGTSLETIKKVIKEAKKKYL